MFGQHPYGTADHPAIHVEDQRGMLRGGYELAGQDQFIASGPSMRSNTS